jgi:hypothetical protein
VRVNTTVGKWLHVRVEGAVEGARAPQPKTFRLVKLPDSHKRDAETPVPGDDVAVHEISPICEVELVRSFSYTEFRFKLGSPARRMRFEVECICEDGVDRTIRSVVFGANTSGTRKKASRTAPPAVGEPTSNTAAEIESAEAHEAVAVTAAAAEAERAARVKSEAPQLAYAAPTGTPSAGDAALEPAVSPRSQQIHKRVALDDLGGPDYKLPRLFIPSSEELGSALRGQAPLDQFDPSGFVWGIPSEFDGLVGEIDDVVDGDWVGQALIG